jgi:hypothetical protein
MKRSLYTAAAVVLAAASFAACSDDDDDAPSDVPTSDVESGVSDTTLPGDGTETTAAP